MSWEPLLQHNLGVNGLNVVNVTVIFGLFLDLTLLHRICRIHKGETQTVVYMKYIFMSFTCSESESNITMYDKDFYCEGWRKFLESHC